MSNFEEFFDPNAKPLRREALFRQTTDTNGNPVIEIVEGESITLSQDGSIDRAKIVPDRFYHCGHSAQELVGGRCGEVGCNHISCHKCFTRCHHCQKPLCQEHVTRVANETGTVDLCSRCKDTLARKQRGRAILHAIISPFVNFNPKTKS